MAVQENWEGAKKVVVDSEGELSPGLLSALSTISQTMKSQEGRALMDSTLASALLRVLEGVTRAGVERGETNGAEGVARAWKEGGGTSGVEGVAALVMCLRNSCICCRDDVSLVPTFTAAMQPVAKILNVLHHASDQNNNETRGKAMRYCLQFFCNLTAAVDGLCGEVFSHLQQICLPLLSSGVGQVCESLCGLLMYLCKEERWWTANLDLISAVLSYTRHAGKDLSLLLVSKLLETEGFMKEVAPSLKQRDRIVLLRLAQNLAEEDHSLCSSSLHHVAAEFGAISKCLALFSADTTGSETSKVDYAEEFYLHLGILNACCRAKHIELDVFQSDSLLLSSALNLIAIMETASLDWLNESRVDDSEEGASAEGDVKEYESVVCTVRCRLVTLVATSIYRCRTLQNWVREEGYIPLILNMTKPREDHPFLKERAEFCISNLTENNAENQEAIKEILRHRLSPADVQSQRY